MTPLAAVLLLVITCACVSNAVADELPGKLEVEATFRFPLNVNSSDDCDYMHRSCAPLSDLWGWKSQTSSKRYALVGVLNGLALMDVTDYSNVHEELFFKGCLTEWRDVKTIGEYAFIVNDKTAFCDCVEQPCQGAIQVMNADTLGMPEELLSATEGSFSKPLSSTGPVSGSLRTVTPENGCDTIATSLEGHIALIPRGECDFATKVRNAENAGAVAVVIYNDRQDTVPPTMGGMSEGIEIPAVMIMKGDGEKLRNFVTAGAIVTVRLDAEIRRNDDHYSRSDGLIVINLADSEGPRKVFQSRKFFSFAHNIYAEEDRNILWACGTSCGTGDEECENLTPHGGIIALDVSDPHEPKLLAVWDDVYIHDVVVQKLGDRYILFGAAIENARVYRFDVTDAQNLGQTALYWMTPSMAHNTWPTQDQNIIYVTHEDFAMPVTIWDIKDVTNVKYIGNFSVNIENATLPHNVFIRDSLIWMSYYSEGVVVYDISSPTKPKFFAHHDTSRFINGFHGVWGIYPLDNNREAYASDIEAGLFILKLEGDIPSDDKDDNEGDSPSEPKKISKEATSGILLFLSGLAVGIVGAATIMSMSRVSGRSFSNLAAAANSQAANEDREQRAPLVEMGRQRTAASDEFEEEDEDEPRSV